MKQAASGALTRDVSPQPAEGDRQRSLDPAPDLALGALAQLQMTHGNQAVSRMLGVGKSRDHLHPPGNGGVALDAAVRRTMEARIGGNLDDVRIHTGPVVDDAARSLGAAALTMDNHVLFRSGRFAPGTPAGDRLLTHELVHVAQSRRATGRPARLISHATDASERQARALADRGGMSPEQFADRLHPPAALVSLAPETWYRGDAVGAPAGKPGGSLHDLGDGMYLTDDRSVADLYADTRASEHARRSPDAPPATPRTRSITVERSSLGKVLDLTKDKRWNEFLSEPLAGHTREKLIRTANENYSRFFKEFVSKHKIDLKQYDAIVGPEFVRGGTQICIRNPEKIKQIEKLLKPVPRIPPSGGRGGGSSGSGSGEAAKKPGPSTPSPAKPKPKPAAPPTKPASPPAPTPSTLAKPATPPPARATSVKPKPPLPSFRRPSYTSGMTRVGVSAGASVGTGLLLGWMWSAMKKSASETPSPKREIKEAGGFLKAIRDKDKLKTIDLVSTTIHEYAREGFAEERGELWLEYFGAYFEIDALPDIADRRAGIDKLRWETVADLSELETMFENVNDALKLEKDFKEKIDAADDLHSTVTHSAYLLFTYFGLSVEDISQILDNLKFYSASHRVTLDGLKKLKKDIAEAARADLNLLRMLNAAWERGSIASLSRKP